MDAQQQIDALERLARLRASGALSDAEYQSEKARLLTGVEKPDLEPLAIPDGDAAIWKKCWFVSTVAALVVLTLVWPWVGVVLGVLAVVALCGLADDKLDLGCAPYAACAAVALVSFGLAYLSHQYLHGGAAAAAAAEAAAAREQSRKLAENQAKEAREKAEEDAEEARKLKEDQEWANKWGITVDEYRALANAKSSAVASCVVEVTKYARWTAEQHGYDYSWSAVDAHRIRIDGQNVRMTNGFGGARDVSYSCVYDINTKEASVESVDGTPVL